jgi:glycosyltransferase involved in cell wall biosynthesis
MISILIPVYNYDINTLVVSLSQQLTSLNITGEIIALDDASDKSFQHVNSAISTLPGVYYECLGENIGRIKIRQKLASIANHPWLLFLDADSEIINNHFIENYIKAVSDKVHVISGGRIYQKEKPSDCSRVLHWKYGKEREKIQKPGTGFMTNNFMIKKEVFERINFPTGWINYGHEDTAIGITLHQLNLNQVKIDNPVMHAQLETASDFILKSEQALRNIPLLVNQYGSKTVSRYIKIYHWAERVKKSGLKKIVEVYYSLIKKKIADNLNSCNPSLFYFDLYRMVYYLRL